MSNKTEKDRITNNDNRDNLGVVTIEDKMSENKLRLFGHVHRRIEQAMVKEK